MSNTLLSWLAGINIDVLAFHQCVLGLIPEMVCGQ